MGLSTHVLDTMHGQPAAGMQVSLYCQTRGGEWELVKQLRLNQDGRPAEPLYRDGDLQAGRYRLLFGVAEYYLSRGVMLEQPSFLDEVSVDFGVANPTEHYHVPLLVSPWTYSTYRGS